MHEDTLAFVALTDASVDSQHGNVQCLSDQDLSGYDFLSVTRDDFVPISVQPISSSQLSNIIL